MGLESSDAVVDEIDGSGGAVACGRCSYTSGLTRMLRRRPSVSSALMVLLGKRFDGVLVGFNGGGVRTRLNNRWAS
jgi:hypothetical protein